MAAGNQKRAGFTLIELLVTIALVVILATIAVPGFQSIIIKSRLAADHNEALVGLNYARSEAVKRRSKVTAVLKPGVDEGGWILEVWHDDGSGGVTCPTGDKCLQVRDKTSSSVSMSTASDGKITFNSLGRLSDFSSLKFEFSHGESYKRCISIGLSGMVSSAEGGCDEA
jgi:type IV fimbrial biogenesis protein FimT